jgi:hypothetical protein
MKYLGIVIIVLALVIGIVPLFTECQVGMKLANGMTAPMKCHWTAIVEMILAAPLAGLGGFLFFGKRKETRQALSVVGAILGIFLVLVPTELIGVCANKMMLCNMVMKPALMISGILVVAACAAVFASSFRMTEPLA